MLTSVMKEWVETQINESKADTLQAFKELKDRIFELEAKVLTLEEQVEKKGRPN